MRLVWSRLQRAACQGAGRPHRHELSLPPPGPAVVFCPGLGSFPSMCCGLGPGQAGMVAVELPGSQIEAVWAGSSLRRPPRPGLLHFPEKTPIPEREDTTKWAPRPGSSLPTCSLQPSAPESALLQMASSWPGPVAARCGRRGRHWLHWAEVTTLEQPQGLASTEGVCLASLGALCPNYFPPRLPHPACLPSPPRWGVFSGRKVRSMGPCGPMSVCQEPACSSSIVSAAGSALAARSALNGKQG